MRLTDLKEGVPKTLWIGVEIEIHQEKMKELYSSTQRFCVKHAKTDFYTSVLGVLCESFRTFAVKKYFKNSYLSDRSIII